MGSQGILHPREQEEVRRGQIRAVGRVFDNFGALFGHEIGNHMGLVDWTIVPVKKPVPIKLVGYTGRG